MVIKTAQKETIEHPSAVRDPRVLLGAFQATRDRTSKLCQPLETEDFIIQSMPDASPVRWHLAHTTWFFETFVLQSSLPAYKPFHPDFVYLFNSYYETVGSQFPRPRRGMLSRPTVKQVFAYRRHVDDHMRELLAGSGPRQSPEVLALIEVGINHEQQHQELILTDIKHAFAQNPLYPVYQPDSNVDSGELTPMGWIQLEEGLRWTGHPDNAFAYDNESPRHRVFVDRVRLADRLVTNAEFLEFMQDGAYQKPELWLSEGWAAVNEDDWHAPLYWTRRDGQWLEFTLGGLRPVNPADPVVHVSYFEADAFTRWSGMVLPREAAWECASESIPIEGNFVERERYHPTPAPAVTGEPAARQMFGDVWEWTLSPYVPYPGYQPPPGAMGEYNGKFMCNQMVLRGGSCATPASHVRRTYRNFFPPDARWQFSGIRLARLD